MLDFKYKGFSYELIVRPWKKGKARYEAIKWQTGFKNLWNRITYSEYLSTKTKVNN